MKYKMSVLALLLLVAPSLFGQGITGENPLRVALANSLYCQLGGGTGCTMTGPIRTIDGTAGTPAIARSGATGHGFYFFATGFGYGTTSANAVRFDLTGVSAERTVTMPNANTVLPVASQVITYSGLTAGRTFTVFDVNQTELSIMGSVGPLTAQAASIGSTALLTSPAAGVYFVCTMVEVTQAATVSSSIGSSVIFTNSASSTFPLTGNLTTNVVGNSNYGCGTIRVVSGNVNYSTTYVSSGATPMQYAVSFWIARVQ